MNEIKETIIKTLKQTEDLRQIQIIHAIESGSRAWGFASPDSDYDCRFIYLHRPDWYISIQKRPDVIEYAPDAVYDINGWDLIKVIGHIVKSNAVMGEWLSSGIIYQSRPEVAALLEQLATDYFNPITVSYHYLSLAKKKFAEVSSNKTARLKTYFYILRPIACLRYIEQYRQRPFMEYRKNLDAVLPPEQIYDKIIDLCNRKVLLDEADVIAPDPVLHTYIKSEIEHFNQLLPLMQFKKNNDYEYADHILRKIIRMVWKHEPII